MHSTNSLSTTNPSANLSPVSVFQRMDPDTLAPHGPVTKPASIAYCAKTATKFEKSVQSLSVLVGHHTPSQMAGHFWLVWSAAFSFTCTSPTRCPLEPATPIGGCARGPSRAYVCRALFSFAPADLEHIPKRNAQHATSRRQRSLPPNFRQCLSSSRRGGSGYTGSSRS